MNEQDYIQLTLFQEDYPASHSLLPGSGRARRMTAISGRKCLELSKNSGPLGLLEKMLLESLEWHSTMCFLTWKVKATPHGRLWFQLAASALRTKDTDLQSWPTPPAMAAAGLGVAILPRLALPARPPKGLRICRLSPPLTRQMGLLTLRGRRLAPAADKLAALVRETATKIVAR